MADLVVNYDAVDGMVRSVASASQSLETLVEVPWCDDVLASATWRLLMLQLGKVITEVAADLQTLSDGANTAMTAYQVTDGSLSSQQAAYLDHRRGERE